MFEAYDAANLAASPEGKAYRGIRDEDYGKWGDVSDEAEEADFRRLQDAAATMEASFDLASLNAQDALSYRLFALTDNVHEIVAHLQDTHQFWPLFEGATVSAEVGLLKPDPLIYRHLLDTHGLEADETVFLDDIPRNVAGAKDAGIHAFLFTTAEQAEADLASLGVEA